MSYHVPLEAWITDQDVDIMARTLWEWQVEHGTEERSWEIAKAGYRDQALAGLRRVWERQP